MRAKIRFYTIVFLTIILAACTSSATTATATIPPTSPLPVGEGQGEEKSSTLTASPTLEPSPTATTIPPQTLYKINANLDYAGHRLGVSQEVYYVNSSNHQLRELVFVVEPNRYEGAFDLQNLTWGDVQTVEEVELEGGILRLALPEPLPPGESISVEIAYELQLPQREGVFGYTERQTNLGDWYPFIPPYDEGVGWVTHEPSLYKYGSLGEHLVYESADFEVTFTLGESANDVTLVGSAPVKQEGNVYIFQAQAARNFTLSASTEYEVREMEWNGVAIRSVFFPEDVTAGEEVLTIAQESLEIYGEVFAPYQHETFTVVESLFPDGMEFDGLVYVGSEYYHSYDSTPYNYLTLITAHETAHQWWYGLVGNDQALEPWLDEILATYSEQIYLEHAHPEAAAWWFNFRIAAYNPQGWVNSTIYDFNGFRPYINAVYLRGATFLGELREEMGDEAFFAFLKEYAESNIHEIAEGNDFFGGLEGYGELLNKYFK